jgi:hypothetical protein
VTYNHTQHKNGILKSPPVCHFATIVIVIVSGVWISSIAFGIPYPTCRLQNFRQPLMVEFLSACSENRFQFFLSTLQAERQFISGDEIVVRLIVELILCSAKPLLNPSQEGD